jgi:hypothetical protein
VFECCYSVFDDVCSENLLIFSGHIWLSAVYVCLS